MRYKINTTFNTFGDPIYRIQKRSQSGQQVTLYKGDHIWIENRMKDMWDTDIEHWQTSCGWLLKITRDLLPYFDKHEE